MSKRRLNFSKTGMAKYISHLDLLRCFTRSIMRAELPAVYSRGFNPHMKMTFSLPLSVGVTSSCECVDIEFESNVTDSEIMKRLNGALPTDIRIISVGDPNISANDIFGAEYCLTLLCSGADENALQAVKEFFSLPEVKIIKRTKKKGEREVNLMDFVLGAEAPKITDEGIEICLTLSAGGQKNLKPEIAAEALIKYLTENAGVRVMGYNIHRTKIFYDIKNPKIFK